MLNIISHLGSSLLTHMKWSHGFILGTYGGKNEI